MEEILKCKKDLNEKLEKKENKKKEEVKVENPFSAPLNLNKNPGWNPPSTVRTRHPPRSRLKTLFAKPTLNRLNQKPWTPG